MVKLALLIVSTSVPLHLQSSCLMLNVTNETVWMESTERCPQHWGQITVDMDLMGCSVLL